MRKGQYGCMKPRFRQAGSVKTKPSRRNKSFEKFFRLSLDFCQKTGFKTEPRRRNNFLGKFISSSESRFLPKIGRKTKPSRRNIFSGVYLFVFVQVFAQSRF